MPWMTHKVTLHDLKLAASMRPRRYAVDDVRRCTRLTRHGASMRPRRYAVDDIALSQLNRSLEQRLQ